MGHLRIPLAWILEGPSIGRRKAGGARAQEAYFLRAAPCARTCFSSLALLVLSVPNLTTHYFSIEDLSDYDSCGSLAYDGATFYLQRADPVCSCRLRKKLIRGWGEATLLLAGVRLSIFLHHCFARTGLSISRKAGLEPKVGTGGFGAGIYPEHWS